MIDPTRREFLAAAALAAAQTQVPKKGTKAVDLPGENKPKQQPPEKPSVPPSERIVLGFIGVGGMGTGLLNTFKTFPQIEIAAVCDVYEPHLERARSAAGGKPEAF